MPTSPTNIVEMFSTMSGSTIIGLDTETAVPLRGGKKNPMQGRVRKLNSNSIVQVFENKYVSGYANMVRRRLEEEDKNPDDYIPKPRKWGVRVPGTPIIEHMKDGILKYYLDVIFLQPGQSTYFLDGVEIDKKDIIGLEPATIRDDAQGGLENMVILRDYALCSIANIRYQGRLWQGPFTYKDIP